MRWNENEVAALAHQPPEWEGRLMHRDGRSGKSAISRLFILINIGTPL